MKHPTFDPMPRGSNLFQHFLRNESPSHRRNELLALYRSLVTYNCLPCLSAVTRKITRLKKTDDRYKTYGIESLN